MIVRRNDELTFWGSIFLRNFLSSGNPEEFRSYAQLASSKEIAFSRSSVRFSMTTDTDTQTLVPEQVKTILGAHEQLIIGSRYSRYFKDQNWLEEFLVSQAHDELPFDSRHMIYGASEEGFHWKIIPERSGREFSRTADETVQFVGEFLSDDMFFAWFEDSIRFTHKINNSKTLRDYMQLSDSSADQVIREIVRLKDHSFKGSDDKKIAWLSELNKESIPILTFDISPFDKKHIVKLSFNECAQHLSRTLKNICVFAAEHNLDVEANPFKRALAISEGNQAVATPPYWTHSQLTECQLTLRRAAIEADHFAGMMSWNDVQSVPKDEAFKRVSNDLVLAIYDSISVSGNLK